MDQHIKLIKRLKDDTFLNIKVKEGIILDTRLNIVTCINNRRFNKITQIDMSKWCKVSIATIKRFEQLQVDSLSLYLKYMYLLYDLNGRKQQKPPNYLYYKNS